MESTRSGIIGLFCETNSHSYDEQSIPGVWRDGTNGNGDDKASEAAATRFDLALLGNHTRNSASFVINFNSTALGIE